MNSKEWRKRTKHRSDMSTRVVHLTRGTNNDEAFENLWKILNERKIEGSDISGFVIGNKKAVCLQELPLDMLAENLMYEKEFGDKVRYSPFGIRFVKNFIYNKGGRPVIYENKERMKRILPKSEYWRIVNLNLADSNSFIDWTHEREWRVPNNLRFKYSDLEVIVSDSKYYKKFVKRCIDEEKTNILTEINGIIPLTSAYM